METHIRDYKAVKAAKHFEKAGWVSIRSDALQSNKSDKGTSGGTLLLHKPWVQSAIPAECIDAEGLQLPDGDLS